MAENVETEAKGPVWVTVLKVLVVPVIGLLITGWFDYRLRKTEAVHNENRMAVQATYDTVTPAVQALSKQVEVLTTRVDLLEKLVLAHERQVDGAASYPALNAYKRKIVDGLSAPLPRAPAPRLPARLEDAVQEMR